MSRLGLAVALCCFCGPVLVPAKGQSADRPATPKSISREAPAATLHAESRLVVVDVVVTRHRQPVNGLTASDFVLLEDGKPQRIAFFEAHQGSPQESAPPDVSAQPNHFTNVSAQTPSSVNVLLFDVLNTPIPDQMYARQQMVQFLKTLPPGYHVALFELGTRLRMITGYNRSSEELVAAATKLVPHGSALLETDEDILQNQRQVAAMAQGLRQYNPGFFDAMSDFMTETSAVIREHRFEMTLQALDELTRSMSGFRGRKNVIWLSEYFPVSFGVMTDNGRFSNLRNYDDLISSTASVLSSSQVAIYPIDVRGITGGFFGNASLPGGPADSVREIGNIEGRHVGMDEIAEQTGGHAYYNTNGLKFAMQRSLESGSEYYTLAYVPPRGADSKYHHIKIRMVRRGLTSEYRRGYFAMPTKPSVNAALDFAGAVQPATPVSNGLLLRARLLLPDQQNANTRVECTIAAENLTFLDQPNDRKLLKLNLLTVAWDGYLNPVANVSNTVELRFSPEQYARVLRDGVTVHQELSLKGGKYDLRLAVMDDGSHRIGTLDVPVEMSTRNVAATK